MMKRIKPRDKRTGQFRMKAERYLTEIINFRVSWDEKILIQRARDKGLDLREAVLELARDYLKEG